MRPITGPGIGRPSPRTNTSPINWHSRMRLRLRLAIMERFAEGPPMRRASQRLVNQASDNARSAFAGSRRCIAISVPVMVAIKSSPPSRSA